MTEANRVTVTDEDIDVHEQYVDRMANAWRPAQTEHAIAKPMIVGDIDHDDESTEVVIGDNGEALDGPELLAHRMANAWRSNA